MTTDLLDRRLPFDLDAEQSVLGSLILRPDCYDDIYIEVSAADFFDASNAELFRQMAVICDAGKPLDVTLLVAGLKAAGTFETVGGSAYIYKICQSVANVAHVVYYARIVRQHAIRRAVIQTATETLREAYEETVDVPTLLTQADSRLCVVSELLASSKQTGDGNIRDVLHEAIEAIDGRSSGKTELLKTGLVGVDRLIGGFRKKQLIVLGAKSSGGKSALLLRLAIHYSGGAKPLNTLFITLEMSESELGERLLSMRSRVNSWAMLQGRLTDGERKAVISAASEASKLKLWIRDLGLATANQIAAECRLHRRRTGGLDVLCIDYLQQIQPDAGGPKNESRQQQLGRICRWLKAMAKEMDILVIVPAQLNRDPDRANREPKMSDLREAADIEQNADMVILAHLPGHEDTSKRPASSEMGEECKLLVRKNRGGPTGEAEMYFFRAFALWGDVAGTSDFEERPPQPRYLEFDRYNEQDEHGNF